MPFSLWRFLVIFITSSVFILLIWIFGNVYRVRKAFSHCSDVLLIAHPVSIFLSLGLRHMLSSCNWMAFCVVCQVIHPLSVVYW